MRFASDRSAKALLFAAFALALVATAACAKGVTADDGTSGEGGTSGGDGGAAGDDGSASGDDSGGGGGDADPGGTTPAGPGDVVLSEIMFDPSGAEPQQEWVEIYNTTPGAKSLAGLSLVDNGGRSHTIASGVTVSGHGFVVLVHDHTGALAAALPGAGSLYEYGADGGGPLLANSAQASIALMKGSTSIVNVPYGGFSIGSNGASIQLKTLTAAASASKASWCESLHPWPGGGDKGTPAAANDCP